MGVPMSFLQLIIRAVQLCCSWLRRGFFNMFNWRSITNKSSEKSKRDREKENEEKDFDTEYDSTWEDDDGTDESKEKVEKTLNAEPVNTEPVNAEPVNTETVNTETVNTEPVNAEPVNTETVNTEAVNAETVNTETVNAEPVNAEPVNTEPVNAEPVNTEPVNTEPANTETVNTEKVKTEKRVDHDSIKWSYSAYRNTYAARDMQNFRHMLKKVEETLNDEAVNIDERDDHELPNLLFYQNKEPSQPDGVFIYEFHEKWFGQYDRLEWVHSYIQWLFPIQEQGLNYDSYKLTPEEIKLFRQDEEAKDRLVKSYKLMLDFYGIELLDEKTGRVRRAKNWRNRFENLNRNSHNNLRITRILKCLGILGFKHYQAPLVRFFLEQTLVEGKLPRVKQSALDYFMFAVMEKSERKELIKFAFQNFKPRDEFVWCPKKIQRRFLMENPSQTTENSDSGSSKPESDAKAEEIQPKTEETADVSTSHSVKDDPSNGVVGDEGANEDPPEEMEVTSPDASLGRNNEEVTDEGQDHQTQTGAPAVQPTDENGNTSNQKLADQCPSNSDVLHSTNDKDEPMETSAMQDSPDTPESNNNLSVQHPAENTDGMTDNKENGSENTASLSGVQHV